MKKEPVLSQSALTEERSQARTKVWREKFLAELLPAASYLRLKEPRVQITPKVPSP